MTQVHAPYHFVPLSSWVYMPEWAHLVSHDHPFKDGLSGVIEYTLTNHTPLLVGGETDANKAPSEVKWARDPEGNPTIPGTSIKGMLRSFLEIATFGKFDQVDDNHFSYRDISNSDTVYSTELQETKEQAAWVRYHPTTKQWMVRECQHTVLFSDDFNKFAQLRGKKIENAPNQSALDKYKLWPLNTKPAIAFQIQDRTVQGMKGKNVTVNCAQQLGAGGQKGFPVFTGFRPGPKRYWDTRLNFNYMFYNVEKGQEAEIPSEKISRMFETHNEELVQYFKHNGHPEYGIPVFLRKKGSQIIAMGFAKMPRKLYDKSIAEVAQQTQKVLQSKSVFDFCDVLFGTLHASGFSLKSRVSFSNAMVSLNKRTNLSSPIILGQPQASFLGGYLEQSTKGEVNTLSDYNTRSKLSGWKRYPAQQKFNDYLPKDLANKPKVQSRLELMAPKAEFKGKLVFHNLKPEELGALLWALSPEEGFHHSLGHGKSLGCGAVTFDAKLATLHSSSAEKLSEDELKQVFASHMNNEYPAHQESTTAWQDSTQIKHLLAFGNKADNEGRNLTYMPLQTSKEDRGRVVSYSSAAEGRTKQVLPGWSVDGTVLARDEKLADYMTPVGKGRLNELLKELSHEDGLTQFERDALQQQQEAEQAAQEAEAMANASEIGQEVLEIIKILTDNPEDTSKVNVIKKLIEKALAEDSPATPSELRQLYELASDYAFSHYLAPKKPTNKKKVAGYNERKEKLKELELKVASL